MKKEEAKQKGKKRVNVYIDMQVVIEAKHLAFDEDSTLGELIEKSLREYISKKK